MVEYIYNRLHQYFNTLENLGSMDEDSVDKLLLFLFYFDILSSYDDTIPKEDTLVIEKALNCIYDSSCLFPYPENISNFNLRYLNVSDIFSATTVVEGAAIIGGTGSGGGGMSQDYIDILKKLASVKVIQNKEVFKEVPDIDTSKF